jgi:hypothetical protein
MATPIVVDKQEFTLLSKWLYALPLSVVRRCHHRLLRTCKYDMPAMRQTVVAAGVETMVECATKESCGCAGHDGYKVQSITCSGRWRAIRMCTNLPLFVTCMT